jgi:anaerobic selenocysteine-containing dehydrogenase
MNLDRRGFIKFLVGGAVGVVFSPLPWKLMDDIAIWTQNWPWVPNPSKGPDSFRNTVSPFGYQGTGLSVRLIDEKRAVTLAGAEGNPLNRGGLGPVDVSALQYHYHKSIRVKSPMLLKGGKHQAVSWDEAMNVLASKLKDLRGQGAADKVALINGAQPGTMTDLLKRFMTAYGSPNYLTMPSARDTEALVLQAMFGTDGTLGYDLENSDYVISFGCGLLEGWGSHRSLLAYKHWHEDTGPYPTVLVQVDTNASTTSSRARRWVAVAPGTEGALALGLAHVIVKEELYDKSFVSNRTFGFDKGTDGQGRSFAGFRDVVLHDYSPEAVSHLTGVPAMQIVELAREFALAKKPLALAGRGKGNMPGMLGEFMAVHSLNALVGAVNRDGGVAPVPAPPLTAWPRVELDAAAERGLNKDRVDGAGSRYPLAESLLNRFSEAVASEGESPVELLMVYRANPAYFAPSSKNFKEAMKKIPFTVSFSSYWNETTELADLVLPDHSFMERWEDGTTPAGVPFPVYVLGNPVFDPMFDTRQTGDVILQTAKALGGSVASSLKWADYESLLKFRVKGIYDKQAGLIGEPGSLEKGNGKGFAGPDKLWEALTTYGCWYDPKASVGSARSGGKFRFYGSDLRTRMERAEHREDGHGSHEAAADAHGKAEPTYVAHFEEIHIAGDPKTHPLLLMPEDLAYVYEGEVPSAPYLSKIWPNTLLKGERSVVQINPATAEELHLREGDLVIMESSRGRAEVLVHLFHGVRPGVVAMAEGFGHTAFDGYIKDKGSNTRDLTVVNADPLSGLPLWWGTRVNLTKA